MKTVRKKSLLSLITVFSLILLMLFPSAVFADDAPPAEETAQEETGESTEEAAETMEEPTAEETPAAETETAEEAPDGPVEEETEAAEEAPDGPVEEETVETTVEPAAEETPAAETEATEEAADEPAEEETGEATEEPVTEEGSEEQLPDPQVTVEPEGTGDEKVTDIVASLEASEAVLVDENGDAISLASEDALTAMEMINSESSDPYFSYVSGSTTAWVGYTHPGGTCHSIVTECHEIENPIQAALDDTRSIGRTIRIDGTATDYVNDVVTFDRPQRFWMKTNENVTLNTINLNTSLSNITYKEKKPNGDPIPYTFFANTVNILGGGATASIQDGVDLVTDDGAVNVGPGTFNENIVIDKSIGLAGAGQDKTIVYPSTSAPNPGGAGSLPTGSSNMIIVESDNVTIHDLTLDGDNPALVSSYDIGGANIDARNGIIINYKLGTFDNLEVYNTTVKNIYLRGIYASSYGTFNFHDNWVENVKGENASNAMMNFGGSGIFANNYVENVNGGIVSNWSTGTSYLNNHVVNASDGIHTDNNYGSGDLIKNNLIENSSWCIFTFAPFVPITVENNTVFQCDIGLTAASSQTSDGSTTFINNTVDGNNKAGSIAGYATTEAWWYFYKDVFAYFYDNKFLNTDMGVVFENTQSPYTPGFDGSSNIFTNLKDNSFNKVSNTLLDGSSDDNLKEISAFYNYWGEDDASTFSPMILGNVLYDPWLIDPDSDAVYKSSDGTGGYEDNCPNTYNPDQLDTDGDGLGDVCDPTPNGPENGGAAGEIAIVEPVIDLPLGLIPVTGGERTEIPCTTECITFILPNGSQAEFCGLCGYSMSISEEKEDTLPFEKPGDVSILLGMTINLFNLDGDMVTVLPTDASLTVGFPMREKLEDLLGIQHWDPANEEWLTILDTLAIDGLLEAPLGWPGTTIFVE